MKFKATLSDRGLRVLERAFLPTLEKLGKRCQVGAAALPPRLRGSTVLLPALLLALEIAPFARSHPARHDSMLSFAIDSPLLQLLLSPEDVHLIQGVTDTDGLQVTARLANVGAGRAAWAGEVAGGCDLT